MSIITANRHELKYTLSSLDSMVLKNRLSKLLKMDKNCADQEYNITSLYFDNLNNTAYLQKINGNSIRHKYRIRYYNDDPTLLKLERKSKVHNMTKKVSAPLTRDELKKIYNGDYDFLIQKEEEIFKYFYIQLSHGLIQPKVIVTYTRTAFVHPVGNLRITFDSYVMTAGNQTDIFEENINYTPAIGTDEVILEIKFNGVIPDFIKNIMQTDKIMQSSSSKYVYSRKYNYQF